jgi:hypothetical protein
MVVVTNETPSKGMKNLHQFDKSNSDKELVQCENHIHPPSNPQLIVMEPSLRGG